jgi:hypothetical protein
MDYTYYLIGIIAIIGFLLLIFVPSKIAVLAIILVLFMGVHIKTRVDSSQRIRELSAVSLAVSFNTEKCGRDRPLLVVVQNTGERRVIQVRWNLAAYLPGYGSVDVNVVSHTTIKSEWETPYSLEKLLAPGQSGSVCLTVPTLTVVNDPGILHYVATNRAVEFAP